MIDTTPIHQKLSNKIKLLNDSQEKIEEASKWLTGVEKGEKKVNQKDLESMLAYLDFTRTFLNDWIEAERFPSYYLRMVQMRHDAAHLSAELMQLKHA